LIPIMAGAPAIGAAAARKLFHRTLRGTDWGLRWREGRLALLGFALPLLYVSASYLVVYALGLGTFDADKLAADAAQTFGAGVAAVPLDLLLSAGAGALALVMGVGVLALFEEIGWRGYLVPVLARLAPAGWVAPLSGLAWAAFHYPLILFVPGASHGLPAWYALTNFTLTIVLLSVPYAWFRLRSRSLWPVVLMHVSHNILFYSIFEPLTADTGITAFAQGEMGFTFVLLAVPVALAFWRPAVREARRAAMEGATD
jgi:membrane protease YdiL (CAAX protease family)